jgi:hypothetical protein
MRLQLDPLSPTGVSVVQQTVIKQTGGYVAKVQFLNELEDVNANPTNNQVLSYDSSSGKWVARTVSGGGGADWGSIGGTLSDQTDLQNALNAKYDASNPSNFIDSAGAPVQSVAGKTGTVTLDKNDVGLGNVDNTSDVNKPISSATQTALDGKENTFSKGSLVQGTNVTLSGTLTNRLVGSGDITISATGGGGGGQVDSVVAGTGIDVDATDPVNPEVSLDSASVASLGLADTALQSGDNVSDLTNDAGYLTSAPVASVNTQTGAVVLDTDDITDTVTNRYTNDTDIARLANTSGTNTGDQDLSGLVPTSRNVNSGTGLTGGGNLTADRTLALDSASQASLALADSALQSGDDISELNNDTGFTTNTGTVTSVAVSGTDGIDVDSGSPVTSSGTIQLGVNASTLKTHLSLNNVDNTSDATKNSATATLTNKTISGADNTLSNIGVASLTNDYMFRAVSTAAQNSGNSAFAKVNFATEQYDYNSNYDTTTSTYTAPVAGIYHFDARISTNATNTRFIISIFKNGSEIARGGDVAKGSAATTGVTVSTDLLLAVNDTIDIRSFGSGSLALATVAPEMHFSGRLVRA